MKKKSLLLLLIFAWSHTLYAQDKDLFEKQLFISGEDTLLCRILTPLNFQAGKKYPVVVFLHGAGERGNDNEAQLNWGADMFLDSTNRAKFPAIIVFPQCPLNSKWSDYNKSSNSDSTGYIWKDDPMMFNSLKLVSEFIDTLLTSNGVDKRRIYIGGLSMGGFGTLELLWRKPNVFAATFPICGAGNPEKIKEYRAQLPIWLFHGEKDPVIPVSNSRLLYNVLKTTSAKAKYTEYPNVGHDSWKNAFMEPSLLPWLFAQKLPSKK
jgi:predicted peptidase